MKRVFIIILAVTFLLTGCVKSERFNKLKADNITVFYGVSSYAMFGADQVVIDDLLHQFNSLTFEKTTKQMDLLSSFNVNFSYKGNNVQNFWIDRNGVFWLDGETQSYKGSSGCMYEYIKAIYEDSRNFPVLQVSMGNVSGETWPLLKEWLKLCDHKGEQL